MKWKNVKANYVINTINNKENFNNKNRYLYTIIFYILTFVSVCIYLLSPIVIRIIFGEEYLNIINSLRIITWYTVFSYLGVARQVWIVCENKQKYIKKIYIL